MSLVNPVNPKSSKAIRLKALIFEGEDEEPIGFTSLHKAVSQASGDGIAAQLEHLFHLIDAANC